MNIKQTPKEVELIPYSAIQSAVLDLPAHARTLRYIGSVTRGQNERVLAKLQKLLDASKDPVGLFITSPGGVTGSAMSFYDTVRHIYKADITTIGSGEVDSSGIIIFLSGTTRLATARTTFLFHSAGRVFGNQRFTTDEMEAMLAEDKLKDEQYAHTVSVNSKGFLTQEDVLLMMQKNTVCTPEDMVRIGLADRVIA